MINLPKTNRQIDLAIDGKSTKTDYDVLGRHVHLVSKMIMSEDSLANRTVKFGNSIHMV